jgi:hypothetical protein
MICAKPEIHCMSVFSFSINSLYESFNLHNLTRSQICVCICLFLQDNELKLLLADKERELTSLKDHVDALKCECATKELEQERSAQVVPLQLSGEQVT